MPDIEATMGDGEQEVARLVVTNADGKKAIFFLTLKPAKGKKVTLEVIGKRRDGNENRKQTTAEYQDRVIL